MDESVWHRANPNLGVSVSLDYLREMCAAAKNNPEIENTFRNLHLNQWTEQAVRWIPMHLWDECRRDFSEDDLAGRPCFAGLDLASTQDTNALTLIFPMEDGSYRVLPYFWIPEKSRSDRAHQDRRQVLNWAAKGLIRKVSGNVTQYGEISEDIFELAEKFDIQVLAYDPWGPAVLFVQVLEQNGFPHDKLMQFRQVIGNFAAPSKEFHRLIACGKLNHDGNPVLRWMAENVAAERDKNDNVRPNKEKSADKIDGIVAAVMALGVAMQKSEPTTSVYTRENRGFVTIG
jgi:phage terminase large subunit-like protein